MPTIYKYLNPLVVDQDRYNVLITRPGYFATATMPPADDVTRSAAPSFQDIRSTGKFPYPRPRVINPITSMQAGHGWTASNALANGMNDNSDVALGSQSAYITSKTDASAATLTKTGLSLDVTATKQLRLLVKITGGDYISQCLLYLSSDSFVANFATINIQGPVADPGVRWLKDGEWKWVTVNLASTMATNNGSVTGSPNYAALDSLRIRLVSTSGQSVTFRLQAVQVVERKSFAANGVVCFTYDDSYRNQYTVAKPHLDKYGYPGTAYTISKNVIDGNAGNTNWLTTQMLKDMRNYSRWEIALHGWDLSAHSRAHAGYTSAQGVTYGSNPMTPKELDTDIDRNLQWLIDNGLTDGFAGHCQPQGRFNPASQAVLTRRTAYARAMTGNSNGCETIPVADPWAVRSYTLDNTTTLAYLQTVIDGVSTHGGLAVFCCHDIVTSPSTSTQFATATHQSLVDYVAGKANLRVMTLGDVMRAHTAQG